jgi:hypothetical protein
MEPDMRSAAPLLDIDTAAQNVAPQPLPPAINRDRGDDFVEQCMLRTADALHDMRAVSTTEIHQGIAAVRKSHAQGVPTDLLEQICRLQGHGEEHLSQAIMELGNKAAFALTPYTPLVPFAGKLIAPSAFYESFDQIHKIARLLLSPVIYAEDTDAIGTASINPFAAAILANEIQNTVVKRFGIRPFVTIARLDYESWAFLTRKHFEI